MKTTDFTNLIENFAPLETQEAWDCSGFQIDFGEREIKKILLCVSVTHKILAQAIQEKCDFIFAHHPLFFVPFELNKNIPIYSAHTNLDKACGGTTDTLIDLVGYDSKEAQKIGDFLRLISLKDEILLEDFISNLKEKLAIKNLRVVNNFGLKMIKNIAFCAGSGAEFINLAKENDADILVTGDVKFHTALESCVIIADVGHFESERPVLKTIKSLLEKTGVEVLIANEESPFITY